MACAPFRNPSLAPLDTARTAQRAVPTDFGFGLNDFHERLTWRSVWPDPKRHPREVRFVLLFAFWGNFLPTPIVFSVAASSIRTFIG